MVTALHWDFEKVDHTDFCRIIDQLVYWAKFPPSHLLLRAMAHFEPAGNSRGRGPTLPNLPPGYRSVSLDEVPCGPTLPASKIPANIQQFIAAEVKRAHHAR